MLGEVEFIIAAEHATFFDPHVTYGMTAAFEPIHMSGIMPFGEIMRLSLLGNYERMSARRAYEIGLVSEIVPERASCIDAAAWAAERDRVAAARSRSKAPSAPSGRARELGQRQALRLGYAYVGLGHEPGLHRRGPEAVRVGHAHRLELAIASTIRSPRRDRRRRAVGLRPRRRQVAVRAPLPGRVARHRRRRPHQGRRRRLRLRAARACSRPIEVAEYLGLRPTWVDGTGVGGARGSSWSSTRRRRSPAGHAEVVVLAYGSTTRADLKRRRPPANLAFGSRGPGAVRRAVRAHADREVRDGRPGATCTSSAPRSSSWPRSRCRPAYNASLNPDAYYRDPDHRSTTCTSSPHDRRPAHDAALLHPVATAAARSCSPRRSGARDLRENAGVGARHRRGRLATPR